MPGCENGLASVREDASAMPSMAAKYVLKIPEDDAQDHAVQLHGVITRGFRRSGPPTPVRYLRMDVKDASGTIIHWAIMFSGSVGNGKVNSDDGMLKPGMMVTIS